jgi:hypothetical protein
MAAHEPFGNRLRRSRGNDILNVMDDTLLKEAQQELMRHNWDTFVNHPPSIAQGGKGVVVPGCTSCNKIIYSNNQYLSHLAVDVLPGILRKFSGQAA